MDGTVKGVESGLSVGGLVIHMFDGAPPAKYYARRIAEKVVSVSETAPQPIRDQALAYQEQIYQVALAFVRQAIEAHQIRGQT